MPNEVTSLCRAVYERPSGEVLVCTFVHHAIEAEHSWFAVRSLDHPPTSPALDPGPITDLKRVILAIEVGVFDEELEAILAAAHNRKTLVRSHRSRRRPW